MTLRRQLLKKTIVQVSNVGNLISSPIQNIVQPIIDQAEPDIATSSHLNDDIDEIQGQEETNSVWDDELEDYFVDGHSSERLEDRNFLLKNSLGRWSVSHGITRNAMDALLSILSEYFPDV